MRSGDTPGQTLPDAERDLEDAGLLEVEIPALDDVPAGEVVPVRLNAVVTELGVLELWMKHVKSDRRWKVEFQVRTERTVPALEVSVDDGPRPLLHRY